MAKTSKLLYYEDVSSLSVKVDDHLKRMGITLTDEQSESLHMVISDALEDFSEGCYQNYN